MDLKIENVDRMSPEEEEAFFEQFTAALAHDDGAAVKAHLAAGRAIYYREKHTPPGHVVKRYPDGRRELVRFVGGKEHAVSGLDAA